MMRKLAGRSLHDTGSKPLLAILLAAAALRALYSMLPMPSGDGGTYLITAQKILDGMYFFDASGDTFLMLYRTPGYPLFLALIKALSGASPAAVALTQHAIGLFSALLAYRIGSRLAGKAAAVCAAIFMGLHFHFIYIESYPLSESLSIFLLLASVLLLLALESEKTRGVCAYSFGGLVLSAAALCRPELAVLAPVFAGYLFLNGGGGTRARSVRTAAYILPILLLGGAWTLRNGLLFDYWGISPNSKIAFFDGPAGMTARPGHEPSDFVAHQAFRYQHVDGRVNKAVFALKPYGIGYQWSAERIGGIALAAAAENPLKYLRFVLGQLREVLLTGSTWPPRNLSEAMPDILEDAPGLSGRSISAIARIDGFLEGYLLLPLFLIGCFAAFHLRSAPGILVAGSAVLLLLTYSFLSPLNMRYRLVVEPLIGLTAALALGAAWSRYRLSGPEAELAPPAWLAGLAPKAALSAAACGLLLFSAGLVRSASARSVPAPEDAAAAGYAEMKLARYPAALDYFEKALRSSPDDKYAGDGKASALFMMGRGREAMSEFCRLYSLYGDFPDHAYMIEYLSGNFPGAAGDFRAFLAFKESSPGQAASRCSSRGRPGPRPAPR